MKSGEWRHYVQLQSYSETANTTGQMVASWSTYANAYISLKPLGGSETEEGGQELFRTQQFAVSMRYLPGISVKDRIDFNGTYYTILTVADPDGRKRYLNLTVVLYQNNVET